MNNYQGHEFVDLGLPSGTLWATCNVGSNTPENCGDTFAWGETSNKRYNSNWKNYTYSKGNNNQLTKYCNKSNYGYDGFIDNLVTIQPSDDAATMHWGNDWHTPSREQWEELCRFTKLSKVLLKTNFLVPNKLDGLLFTASNGCRLFLPANRPDYGRDGGGRKGACGHYWSSSLHVNDPSRAWYFYFYSEDDYYLGSFDRSFDHFIRPVHAPID